jgi:predicted DNA-binding transcriptional regulator YafY
MNGALPPYETLQSRPWDDYISPPRPWEPTARYAQTWENAYTHPVYTASPDDTLTTQLLLHLYQRHPISIIYHGGSTPGETRTILPIEIIRKPLYHTNYLIAHCQKRQKTRTFNLEKIELIKTAPTENQQPQQ